MLYSGLKGSECLVRGGWKKTESFSGRKNRRGGGNVATKNCMVGELQREGRRKKTGKAFLTSIAKLGNG